MKKTLPIQLLITFLMGIFVGMIFSTKIQAQAMDQDSVASVTSHLRASHNPNEASLSIKVIPGNKSMKYVKIFDIIGNEVASVDLTNRTNFAFSVDLSHFESGIYLCNLYSDKGIVETRKVYWSK